MKFDAVILAAGQGKRMKPFNKLISKPMLPILNKPFLALIVEQLLTLKAERVIIVASPFNIGEIKDFFDQQNYSEKINYTIQKEQKGTADAIYTGGLKAVNEIIFSVAGDNLFSDNFTATMIDEFDKYKIDCKCLLALRNVSKEEITKLASVELDKNNVVKSITEKPDKNMVVSTLASFSMYIFDKSLLSYFNSVNISTRGELEATDAIHNILSDNIQIKGSITTEDYIHISNPYDLWKFNMDFLGSKENEIALNVKLKEKIQLKKCVVGDNVLINENSVLEECVILSNANIPANSSIKKAIIGLDEKGAQEIYTI